MWERLSRRGILAGGFAGLAGLAFPSSAKRTKEPRRVLRLAHFTDVHLTTAGEIPKKAARCFDKIWKAERPDVVFNGGDIVWDACQAERNIALAEYDLANQLLARHLPTQVVHCVGNHDVWGWTRNDRNALQADPQFGKGMWLKWTGYSSPYFSFDRENWHFIVLDSIQPSHFHGGYAAQLDESQWRWLQQDLATVSSTTPVCIVSHAPFIHAGVQFMDRTNHGGRYLTLPGSLIHSDTGMVKDLLAKHRNVRLCLSGHIHMFSRVHYNGVAHIGNGAVSGAWWRGDMQETPPGYAVVDLYEDGRVKSRFETY